MNSEFCEALFYIIIRSEEVSSGDGRLAFLLAWLYENKRIRMRGGHSISARFIAEIERTGRGMRIVLCVGLVED